MILWLSLCNVTELSLTAGRFGTYRGRKTSDVKHEKPYTELIIKGAMIECSVIVF